MKGTTYRTMTLDALLGRQAMTLPADLYMALYTDAPDEEGGGDEVSGGGYERVQIANNLTNNPEAEGGTKSNGTVIEFEEATSNWGDVVAWALHDDPTEDSIVLWGMLDDSVFVSSGDTPKFGVGDLQFEEL